MRDARRRFSASLGATPLSGPFWTPFTLWPKNENRIPLADSVVVCRCEEVTAGQIRQYVELGCLGPNQTKAFGRCGMGLCQGRFCGLTVTETIAQARGIDPGDVGYYRIRPPIKPVMLGDFLQQPNEFPNRNRTPNPKGKRLPVIAKAEWTTGEANPRFVVTSLSPARMLRRSGSTRRSYCARGDMENRIKECQLDMFADRTSAATMRANQLRLWFASHAIRHRRRRSDMVGVSRRDRRRGEVCGNHGRSTAADYDRTPVAERLASCGVLIRPPLYRLARKSSSPEWA